MIKIAESDREIDACFETMSELRPHLVREAFVPLVRGMLSEGYRMAYIEDKGVVVAVAGYRILTSFHLGRHMYVNDLVTSTRVRSAGFGTELIQWLRSEAKRSGCGYLDLDSGTHRGRAHKFYFTHGFTISSYHFSQQLVDS